MFHIFIMVQICESDFFFFHIILLTRRGGSPAMRKLERYSVQKVTGDGRCLFRALVTSFLYSVHVVRLFELGATACWS
jgi:hypothetical protein